jgi:diguanylate cyclase (GGDEF)-like protein/PAS domain S-box-containing protein
MIILNPTASSQPGAWRKAVAVPLSSLLPDQHYRRLCFFVTCSIFAVWAGYATSSVLSSLICSLSLVSLIAVSYFASEQDNSRIPRLNVSLTKALPNKSTPPVPEGNDQLFRTVFDNAAGMALVAPNSQWVTVNRAVCSILGYSHEELLTRRLQDIAHPDDIGPTLVQIEKLIGGGLQSHQTELRFTHKLGHLIWVLLNISAIHDADGTTSHLVFQFQDVTDRKLEEERLVHSVFHDALTGLPNRALFMDRLRLATERWRRRKDQLFAVLFLDLDCFKTINDSMGHIMGDQLLIQVARRLKNCLRTTDTIARLGGDEFTILLEDLGSERESLRVVERLQSELTKPFKVGTREVLVTASIGVTSSTMSHESAEEILRDADMAMYAAKSSGKACYHINNGAQHTPQLESSNLAIDLEEATERGELLLYYQPIVSLETGKLCAMESLVRWQHPRRGLISPSDFIRLAEDLGSILKMGNWVLRTACLQLKRWQEQFPFHASLAVTVNLSAKQLMQPDFVDKTIEILQETQIEPHNLKLEITETVLMENVGTAMPALQQLRALGIELAIDDFGTGYSSLSYLHSLPISSLKIDRSFVSGMVGNRDHAEIVKTIVTLARSLGIRVIAEGVETLEQLIQLRQLQCDSGQGFLFSKPGDAATVDALVKNSYQWQGLINSIGMNHKHSTFGSAPTGRPLLRAV